MKWLEILFPAPRQPRRVQVNDIPGAIELDEDSTALANAARRRARESGTSFGEAFNEIRREGLKVNPDGSTMAGAQHFSESPGIALDQTSVSATAAARRLAAQKKITFGEALSELRARSRPVPGASTEARRLAARVGQFNEAGSIGLDEESVLLAEAARKRAREDSIDFGAALRLLRAEGFEPGPA